MKHGSSWSVFLSAASYVCKLSGDKFAQLTDSYSFRIYGVSVTICDSTHIKSESVRYSINDRQCTWVLFYGSSADRHVRPAKTQISLGIRPVWSESSLSAWRKLGSLATHRAHSEDSDQTGRRPRLIWVFAGCTVILLVLSWGGSFEKLYYFSG